MSAPLGEERRNAITDAGLHLVATRGLRGLTHRAVDAEVGLPPGSTSYYLRTRQALLEACLDRMLALDSAMVRAPAPGRSLPDVMVDIVVEGARTRGEHAIARYEFLLEATRQPELRAVMERGARGLRTALAGMLEGLGVPDPAEVSWPVAAMVDGLLRDRVAGLAATQSQADYEASVRRAIAALFRGLAES